MSQECLDQAFIDPSLVEMRGYAVPEDVGSRLGKAGSFQVLAGDVGQFV